MRSHPIGTGQATKSDEFSEGGGHFQSKNLYMQILDLYKGLFRTFSEKKIAIQFFQNECGRSKAVWNFSENSSELVV